MATGFPTKINFTNGNVLSAGDLNDVSGTLNSLVTPATYPNQLSFPSAADSVLRPIPFATSAGTTTVTLSSGTPWSTGAAVVTFSIAARFTQTPIVTVTSTNSSTTVPSTVNVYSTSTTGCTIRAFYYAASTGTITTAWSAVQMTSAAAANS